MKSAFLSTLAVIAPDPAASRGLYAETLGLTLVGSADDYQHTDQIVGCKHFAIWPLSQAAEACFGQTHWPEDRPVPQVSIEFDVADGAAVTAAAQELQQGGYELLHPTRVEPWGQTVARLQSAEGVIIGISHIPSMHDENQGHASLGYSRKSSNDVAAAASLPGAPSSGCGPLGHTRLDGLRTPSDRALAARTESVVGSSMPITAARSTYRRCAPSRSALARRYGTSKRRPKQ
jgi:catechol 2,3-dioxygenase-like lactoylglutathione lyase family enzyme